MVLDQMSAKDPKGHQMPARLTRADRCLCEACKLFYCLGYPCQGFIDLWAATYCVLISHVVLCGMSMAV
jgi:hypothetical protein